MAQMPIKAYSNMNSYTQKYFSQSPWVVGNESSAISHSYLNFAFNFIVC